MVRLNVTLNAASVRDAENLVEGLRFQVPGTQLETGCISGKLRRVLLPYAKKWNADLIVVGIANGNHWLRWALIEAAQAASRTKGTYLAAQFHRLAARRGKKRAVVALGHTLLTIVYYVLKRQTSYVELGADFLDHLDPDRLARQLVKRLEKLGHKVTLEPRQDAA